MISVLVPVFNRDVSDLVESLICQVSLRGKDAEIVVMDDGSESSYKKLNCKLGDRPGVQYLDSDINNGRIKIRQLLAEAASYEWLLFLDCDSKIVSDQFIKNYLQQVADSVSVIMGGRIYTTEKPNDCHFMLHWLYGSKREVTRLGRKSDTNRFMTNNFFIRKSIFKKFNFSEGWNGYGYEDTWMNIQLEAMDIAVKFIDNPVLHNGLENSLVFLAKSEDALLNLKRLTTLVPENIIREQVKLYDYFCLLKSWRLLWMVRAIYVIFQTAMRKNLCSCNPSLMVFDLYRLGWFCHLK